MVHIVVWCITCAVSWSEHLRNFTKAANNERRKNVNNVILIDCVTQCTGIKYTRINLSCSAWSHGTDKVRFLLLFTTHAYYYDFICFEVTFEWLYFKACCISVCSSIFYTNSWHKHSQFNVLVLEWEVEDRVSSSVVYLHINFNKKWLEKWLEKDLNL